MSQETRSYVETLRGTNVRERVQAYGALRIALYAVLLGLVAAYLIPLYGGVLTAVKTVDAFAQTLPFTPPGPDGFTLEPWSNAWEVLSPSMINSFLFTVPATVLSALLGSMAAYGLTLVNWRGQVGLMVLFIAAIFLPKQAILVPLSRFWAIVDVESTLGFLWGLPLMRPHYADIFKLIVTHTLFGISVTTLLFRGYYLTVSEEMLEAARLDGASLYSIYRNIVLPLSKPMFAVVLIFQFTQIWNEFLYGLVIVGGGDASPITVALNELNSGFVQRYNDLMAGAFITALPTLVVYILFGEQFAKGIATESQ